MFHYVHLIMADDTQPCKLRFAAALLPELFGNNVPGHTTREPQVGFELAPNGIQFDAIANLYKTSLYWMPCTVIEIRNLHTRADLLFSHKFMILLQNKQTN